MCDQSCDRRRLREQRVEALGVKALEIVTPIGSVGQLRRELAPDRVELATVDEIGEHDVSVRLDPLDVLADGPSGLCIRRCGHGPNILLE